MTVQRAILIATCLFLITCCYIAYLLIVGTDGTALAALVGIMAGLAGYETGKKNNK